MPSILEQRGPAGDRRDESSIRDKSSEWQLWMLGALLGLVMLFGSAFVSAQAAALNAAEASIFINNSRITVLETEMRHLREVLERLEAKMDRAVNAQSEGRPRR